MDMCQYNILVNCWWQHLDYDGISSSRRRRSKRPCQTNQRCLRVDDQRNLKDVINFALVNKRWFRWCTELYNSSIVDRPLIMNKCNLDIYLIHIKNEWCLFKSFNTIGIESTSMTTTTTTTSSSSCNNVSNNSIDHKEMVTIITDIFTNYCRNGDSDRAKDIHHLFNTIDTIVINDIDIVVDRLNHPNHRHQYDYYYQLIDMLAMYKTRVNNIFPIKSIHYFSSTTSTSSSSFPSSRLMALLESVSNQVETLSMGSEVLFKSKKYVPLTNLTTIHIDGNGPYKNMTLLPPTITSISITNMDNLTPLDIDYWNERYPLLERLTIDTKYTPNLDLQHHNPFQHFINTNTTLKELNIIVVGGGLDHNNNNNNNNNNNDDDENVFHKWLQQIRSRRNGL